MNNSKSHIIEFTSIGLSNLRPAITKIEELVHIAKYYPRNDEMNNCLIMIESCIMELYKSVSRMEEFMKNEQEAS